MTSSIPAFKPSHSQPFTLEEAMLLEVNTLVQEVSRLQNSINHLRRTQVELRSYLEEDDDADIRLAVEENDETIASQTERIDLIIVALENKVGRDALGHYGLDLPTSESGSAAKEGAGGSESGSRTSDRAEVQVEVETEAENDGGLHL